MLKKPLLLLYSPGMVMTSGSWEKSHLKTQQVNVPELVVQSLWPFLLNHEWKESLPVPAGLRTAILAFAGTAGPLSPQKSTACPYEVLVSQLLQLRRARSMFKETSKSLILY